jgi:hypothetical protein
MTTYVTKDPTLRKTHITKDPPCVTKDTLCYEIFNFVQSEVMHIFK